MRLDPEVARELPGAGFAPRLIAYVVDSIILGIIGAGLRFALTGSVDVTAKHADAFGRAKTEADFGALVVAAGLSLLAGIIYTVGFWSLRGATPGKMVMGLEVINSETGEPPGPGRALLRYLGYFVSSAPALLGFLWVILDSRHEAWHDKLS